ncbi:MAG: hypothetical protein HYT70_02490 [Candidatus Aenigmarchaeota archaeon]|nr:hypothetical protein [Candidatus Aenigmarchaeota archaeon]
MQQHYTPKEISKVDSKDSRVCLIGKVVDSAGNSFVLDDGTGKIEIIYDGAIDANKLVRVFCSIADEKLKADVVQDVEDLDMNLFKKVKGLYNLTGV